MPFAVNIVEMLWRKILLFRMEEGTCSYTVAGPDSWYWKNDRCNGAISQTSVLRKRDPEEEDCSLDTPKGK